MIHFKETGHWINPAKQTLRICALPNTVFYVKNQQEFYEVIFKLECEGKGWGAEVVEVGMFI